MYKYYSYCTYVDFIHLFSNSRFKSALELFVYCKMSCRLKINIVLSCFVPGGPPGMVIDAEQADPPTAAENGGDCVLCNPNNSK